MDNSLTSIVDSASGVLILLPTKPYFDQVAAGLSLYLSLRDRKETTIVCPSPMLVEFNRLVGVNKIAPELGNKNLIIKFTDYKASDIERVSYDIEDAQFRLSVIPKPGAPSPKKEQLALSYSGVNADCVILIGGGNETHFPALSSNELAGAKLVHIGTRALAVPSEKGVISLARPGSSISEVVSALINENSLSLDADIATNLLMGVEEGSNHFSGPDVTANTFQVFAELLRAGGQRTPKVRVEIGTLPPGFPANEPVLEEVEKKEAQDAPKDWLEQPKVYKGTSIS